MKRALLVVMSAVVFLGLFGCKSRHESIMNKAVIYAENNEELLCTCAQELCELISDQEDVSEPGVILAYKIEQINGATMRLINQIEETQTEFQSDSCRDVFDGSFIESIMIHYHNANFNTVFSCAGYGFGPNTSYYDIEFLPSGDARDLWWYNKNINYFEANGGFFGEEDDGDDSFYFYPISERLFYCEAHF